jgi:hypothetical protein
VFSEFIDIEFPASLRHLAIRICIVDLSDVLATFDALRYQIGHNSGAILYGRRLASIDLAVLAVID